MSGSRVETKVMEPVGGAAPSEGSAGSADRRWIVLPVLCLSVFLVVVDNTIVNVALPTLNRTLGASITSLQWIVDAYSLAFAGLLLAGGGIGDRLGRKGTMQVGLVFFGLFSAAAAFSDSTGTLIATRALMGAGGRLHLPRQPGDPHERLPGPIRTAEGARDLGRHVGHRGRLRANRRRGAARALLVRVDLLGERADRGRDADRRRVVDPAAAASAPASLRHPGRRRLDGGDPVVGAGHHRGSAVGLGLGGDAGLLRGRRGVARRRSPCWSCAPRDRCSTCGSSRSPVSPVGPCRSRWRSSACSASSS